MIFFLDFGVKIVDYNLHKLLLRLVTQILLGEFADKILHLDALVQARCTLLFLLLNQMQIFERTQRLLLLLAVERPHIFEGVFADASREAPKKVEKIL